MKLNALGRPDFARAAIVYLATFSALALLGTVLAYWTWTAFAPRPEPRTWSAGEAATRAESARGLFGSSPRDRAAAVPAASAIRLLGIVAATGDRPGYAVVRLDARSSLAVRAGENVAPGIRLAEVHPDHVVLDRNGVREKLDWPRARKP